MSNEVENNVLPRTRRRLYAFGALTAAAALTLVGCGGDDDTPSTEPGGSESSAMDESPMDETPMDDETPKGDETTDDEEATDTAAGVYRDYTEDAVSEDGYDRTILFFHAEWCPECRAFEAELNDTELPEGLQILKVDYDTATDLKQEHDVTIQTTFVDVDDEGKQLSSWVGYEKDRDLDTILAGLG